VGDRAIVWVTLHARHTGPFVAYGPDGSITDVFPPTGRTFATRQVHWFRIAGSAIAEHDTVRDDLGMARQAGWVPPTPAYAVRVVLARRRERAHAARQDSARFASWLLNSRTTRSGAEVPPQRPQHLSTVRRKPTRRPAPRTGSPADLPRFVASSTLPGRGICRWPARRACGRR
jgi:hypothetical protein